MYPGIKRTLQILMLLLGLWLGVQYALPIVFPFLLGTGLALAAEPGVRFLHTRFRLPRALGAGLCVSMVFLAILAGLAALLALVFRELGALSGILPAMAEAVRSGINALRSWLSALSERAPESLRPALEGTVAAFFPAERRCFPRVWTFFWVLPAESSDMCRTAPSAWAPR